MHLTCAAENTAFQILTEQRVSLRLQPVRGDALVDWL